MDKRLKLTLAPAEIDSSSWEQIKNVLSLPCLTQLAIMPDVHAGYDLCIGGVALLEGHVSPGFVGYDIGCGMVHVTTDLTVDEIDLHQLYAALQKKIPVGFHQHDTDGTREIRHELDLQIKAVGRWVFNSQATNAKAAQQLGTLGGGNHFLQVGVNENNRVGVTIHSGSRNAGHTVATVFMQLASSFGKQYPVPHGAPLAVLHENHEHFDMYRQAHDWAVQYAFDNREEMMRTVLVEMGYSPQGAKELMADSMINEAHNFFSEHRPGEYLHRKGATPAHKGQLGIIPANIRDGVFITQGLGNEKYLCSASHGCGRALSRRKAKEQLDAEEFQGQVRGILCRSDEGMLDEAPGAYKEVSVVLGLQDGFLVDVIDRYKPKIVLKG